MDKADNTDGKHFFNICTHYIDKHIRVVRYVSYGLATVGLVIILKNTRAFTKFTHLSTIPERYIDKHVKLRGHVTNVSTDGLLAVEHIPIFTTKRIFRAPRSTATADCLTIKLSHIQPSADVANWMKNNIEHSNIWFQVMSTEHSILNCIVCKHNRFWSRSVNEQLIQDGIGVVDSEHSVAGNALYDKHLVRLIKLENKASKKNVGIWKEESVWQRWRNNKWHWPWPFKKD